MHSFVTPSNFRNGLVEQLDSSITSLVAGATINPPKFNFVNSSDFQVSELSDEEKPIAARLSSYIPLNTSLPWKTGSLINNNNVNIDGAPNLISAIQPEQTLGNRILQRCLCKMLSSIL
ncbi:MAG: hypothetical protein IPP79_20700 [Chitinophagaceae bacterium]|nr:hypothetical protein [Chitinophagaceae bacterium]